MFISRKPLAACCLVAATIVVIVLVIPSPGQFNVRVSGLSTVSAGELTVVTVRLDNSGEKIKKKHLQVSLAMVTDNLEALGPPRVERVDPSITTVNSSDVDWLLKPFQNGRRAFTFIVRLPERLAPSTTNVCFLATVTEGSKLDDLEGSVVGLGEFCPRVRR